ncbi:phosphoenolpyruvate carboxykinase (ATP) [Paenibacillus cremeus]|uniref:Phosphoenolpyruvate carboxykinase (ATP) n=1 Tax=Paenibacillus cremeus TaxID=2163881 RepID=A0A559K0C0_9BACL|nr:phosphoenolpyruvate carboxykinase (ATP) [Paenibacillus cremeus]TVY05578.1 phosphoenolpyruvate carboxykinase (ATP) [Paenibacillus cremeus]
MLEELTTNLSDSRLVEISLKRKEGALASSGALRVLTGKYTGRSDKYIVEDTLVTHDIDWGTVNPISSSRFERLYQKAQRYMDAKELFIFDGFAGTDPGYRLPIRIVNEYAWYDLRDSNKGKTAYVCVAEQCMTCRVTRTLSHYWPRKSRLFVLWECFMGTSLGIERGRKTSLCH